MIGDGIKYVRKQKGLTQEELAEKIKVSITHVSQVELGKKKPSMKMLELIAECVSIPLPIIFWMGFKREEIPIDIIHIFDILKPSIDQSMNEIFSK